MCYSRTSKFILSGAHNVLYLSITCMKPTIINLDHNSYLNYIGEQVIWEA